MENKHPYILNLINYEPGIGNEIECGASPS